MWNNTQKRLAMSALGLGLGVISSASLEAAPGDNLALGGQASQSSTLLQGSGVTNLQFPSALKAIDGNSDGNFSADQSPLDGQGTVSHTLDVDVSNHWWEVNLNFSQNVGEIVIHNRTDANSANLAGAVVTVLDNAVDRNVVFTSAPLTGDAAPQSLVADVRGTIVRIEKSGNTALSLAEVEVIEGVSQIPATSVGGRVVREFDFDGAADLALFEVEEWEGIEHRRMIRHGEFPLPGATVNVFDEDNNLVGTTVSDADGFWEVDATGAVSSALRVEFVAPSGYEQTPLGSGNTSSIAFSGQGDAEVNFAAGAAADFAEDNPNYIFVCFARTNDPVDDRTILSLRSSEGIPFRSRDVDASAAPDFGTPVGTLPEATSVNLATISDVSATTLGMAWDRQNQRVLTGAFERSFTAMGDDGAGGTREAAIYSIGANGGVSLWLDLENLLGADVGGIDGPLDTSVPNGNNVFGQTPDEGQNLPGHIGLGSLAISRDSSELYAVNLFSQEVYVIPIQADGSAPTSSAQIRAFPLPTLPPSTNPLPNPLPDGFVDNANGIGWDDNGDGFPDRPTQAALGLGVHPVTGEVYATVTRTGPSLDDLEGYVYSFDPTDTTPSAADFSLQLTIPMNHVVPTSQPNNNTWHDQIRHPWETLDAASTNYPEGGNNNDRQHIMPWLGEVEFDLSADGKVGMIVTTRNRYHDIISSAFYVAGGVSYRICNAGSETAPVWELENNGECDGFVSEFDQTITSVGPPSAFYDSTNRFFGSTGREGPYAAGTTDILPGFAEMVIPGMDNVFNSGTSGLSWLNISGQRSRDARLLGNYQASGFGQVNLTKSNNWGSIVGAPGRAPIEVGNLVWIDTDSDGIQDPSEGGFSGVEVQLRDPSGAVIATAITDENGNYSFINDERFATGGTGSTSTVFVAGLTADTTGYQVCIDSSQTRIASTGVAPTTANVVSGANAAIQAGSDLRDSDGVLNGGEICSALFNTDSDGSSNHSFDFGFQGVVVGDFVWSDVDGDGVQDPNESGIAGVEVKLLDAFGVLVATTVTTDAGFYQFTSSDGLAANTDYQVCIDESQDVLEGFGLVNQNQGGDDDLDSDAENTSNPGFAVIDFTAPAVGGVDLSLDFGFGQIRIGDLVWADGNGDGLQDPTEEGIEGVVVKLLNADGSPFLQTFSEDYQDDFESGVAGSIGATDWSETPWDLGADVIFLADGANMVLQFGDSNNNSETSTATRALDLSDCVSDPTLTFQARELAADNNEELFIEYSTDGSSFISLGALNNIGGTFISQSFTLPRAAVAVRFVADTALANNEFWQIDDIQISCSDTIAVATTTDSDGLYEFSSSANGIAPNTTYLICIEEEQPALLGFTLVPQNQGDDALDSDAENTSSPGLALITAVTPSAGNEDLSFDFGFGQVRIGDFVWFDEDGDGLQGVTENGIAGVLVKLLDNSGVAITQTETVDFQDDFESGDLAGSTGLTDWSVTPWVASGGFELLTDTDGDGAIRLGNGSPDGTIEREIDLSACVSTANVPFSFDVRHSVASGDNVIVEYSEDGTNFVTIVTLSNGNTTGTYQSSDVITGGPFTIPNTATSIRFRGSSLEAGDDFFFDNIVINCSEITPVTTVTDSTGFYEFTSAVGLEALTTYQVCIDNNQTPIVDLALTTQNSGGVTSNDPVGDNTDSDASSTITPGASVITLTTPAVGNENLGYDFGFTEVNIGNFVWFDSNGNGLFDTGEQGIDGITVVLLNSNGSPVLNRFGQPAVQVTSGGGFYEFTAFDGVEPTGSYIISIDLSQDELSTFSLTGQDAGGATSNDPVGDDSDSDAENVNGFAEIAVTAPTGGNENQTFDFGFGRVSIGNFIWNDIDGDGIQDPTEPGIEGVVVKLLDDLGQPITQTVGVDYADDLESGGFSGSTGVTDWSVTPWVSNGVTIIDDSGTTDGTANAFRVGDEQDIVRLVDLSSCPGDANVSFRYREAVNANGETMFFEYTEDGSAFTIVETFNNTGGSQPYFTFTGMIPNTATGIRFRGNTNLEAADFYVVDDVVVTCLTVTPVTTTTDEDGFYSFDSTDGLQAEVDYQLCVDLTQPVLGEFSLTAPNAGGDISNDPISDDSDSDGIDNGSNQAIITLTAPESGQNNNGYDFGFGRLAIGNFVWRDVDGDGLQGTTEPGIEGVVVKLLDDLGQPITQTVGVDYADDLESGGFSGSTGVTDWSTTPWTSNGVTIIDDSGTTDGTDNALRVGDGQDIVRLVDLSSCSGDANVSFRYREAVNANGETMFFEYTEDGSAFTIVETFNNTGGSQPYFTFTGVIPNTATAIRFRGNTSLEAADFYVVDDVFVSCFETVAVIQATDADGFYEFTSSDGLEAETDYQLCVDLSQQSLTGLLITTQDSGGITSNDPLGDDSDSDASDNGSGAAIISLTSPSVGNENPGYDFGFVETKIGNFVWNDLDGDGLQGAGEPGIDGVTVRLLNSDGSSATATSGVDYQDDFESNSDSGSTGLTDWSSTPWIPAGGASLVFDDGDISYSLTGSSTSNTVAEAEVSRPVDLSACADTPNVAFSFDVRGTLSGGAGNFADRMNVEYSLDNGASYTTIVTYNAGNLTNVYQSSDDLTGGPLTIPNTATNIRFSVFSLENAETFWIDNVVVSCTGSSPIETVTADGGIYCFTTGDGLLPDTSYIIEIDESQAPLSNFALTGTDSDGETSNTPTSDDSDSDAENTSTVGFARIAVTSPSAGEVNNSYDFGFVEGKANTYAGFLLDNAEALGLSDNLTNGVSSPGIPEVDPLTGAANTGVTSDGVTDVAGLTDNPDGDLFNNLLEFALCYDPGSGAKSFPSGERNEGLQLVQNIDGTTDVTFSVPTNATELSYQLESSLDGKTWTSVTTTPTVVENPAILGVSTTTIAGVQTVDVDGALFRVQVTATAATPSVTAFSPVVGFQVARVLDFCQSYSDPTLTPCPFSGTVSEVSGQVLSFVDSVASQDLTTVLNVNADYYVEVVSGVGIGNIFDVDSFTAATITLSIQTEAGLCSLDPPFNTLLVVPDLSGSQVVIREHRTIGELFPPSDLDGTGGQIAGTGFTRGATVDTAANLLRWDRDSNSLDIYYLNTAGDWLNTDGGGVVNGFILPPGEGIFTHDLEGATAFDLVQSGEVRTTQLAVPMKEGLNFIASVCPVVDQSPDGTEANGDTSCNSRQLNASNVDGTTAGTKFAMTGDGAVSRADQIFLWNDDSLTDSTPTAVPSEHYEALFLLRSAGGLIERWTEAGATNLLSMDNTLIFESNRSVFLQLQSDTLDYYIVSPVSNN